MVYEAVHEKYPEISKATVYRLLAEAAEDGDILRLKLTEANDRYDVTLDRHYHIICRECGAVADVKTKVDEQIVLKATEGFENFSVEDIHIEFSGLCEKCQATIK
jgi:Fe2+ or Zn2+ uptake regulation protein